MSENMAKLWKEKALASLKTEDESTLEKTLRVDRGEGLCFSSYGLSDGLNPIVLNVSNENREVPTQDFQLNLEKNDLNFDEKILINSSHIHNAGGSIVTELLYLLSIAHYLLENDYKNDIFLQLSCDSKFFHNIAKLRATRKLISYTLSELGSKQNLFIISENSRREQSLLDAENNMLRNVTSSMSALLGGADSIIGLGFDESEVAKRQNKNTETILREESFLGQVNDPASGSYIIEQMTVQILNEVVSAWEQIETKSFDEKLSFFQNRCDDEFKSRVKRLEDKKELMVGVNHYRSDSAKKSSDQNLSFMFPLRRLAKTFEERSL